LETEKFKLSDIFNGVIIPLILVLLIFLLAVYVNVSGTQHIFGESNVIAVILTSGFAQMIILGIPLVLGLLWNKWAGGAAGFIMGGIYYVANAGQFTAVYAVYSSGAVNYNFFGDLSMLFYLVNAVIIGYMAGALNNGSSNFKRMLGAGLTAAIITALIQLFMNYNYSLSPARSMAHQLWTETNGAVTAGSLAYGFTLAFIPSIALGVIVPILAKVMTWYGIQPMRHK
jgi:hypothetical protein